MRSSIIRRRSVVIVGHKTSICLEDSFWNSLKEIAAGRGTTVHALISQIDGERESGNLSSTLRLFVLDYYRSRSRNGDQQAQREVASEARDMNSPTDASTARAPSGPTAARRRSGAAGQQPPRNIAKPPDLLRKYERTLYPESDDCCNTAKRREVLIVTLRRLSDRRRCSRAH